MLYGDVDDILCGAEEEADQVRIGVPVPEHFVRDEAAHVVTGFGSGPDSSRLRTIVQCDESWRPIATTNANGVTTFYVYDATGELVRVRTDGLPTEEYAYDALGHLREVRLPGPDGSVRVTSITNNPFGKPLRVAN